MSRLSCAHHPRADNAVFVVNDDEQVRSQLSGLLDSVGLRSYSFCCAESFLSARFPEMPNCVLLDTRLHGANGLELQTRLGESYRYSSIVFVTRFADVHTSVRAMKAGAIDFLTIPFREQDMLDAVFEALSESLKRWNSEHRTRELRTRLEQLTGREREVMHLVVRGLLNKQVADSLGITETTVKIHRSRVMEKMQAPTFADLVMMGNTLGMITQEQSTHQRSAPGLHHLAVRNVSHLPLI